MLQSENKFRRIKGYKSMSVLVAVLEQYITQKDIDTKQKAA
jgi:hypothetical protein